MRDIKKDFFDEGVTREVSALEQVDLSAVTDSQKDKTGGIDLRALPIVTQPIQPVPLGMQVKPLAGRVPVESMDLEWQQIQRMIGAGIIPSSDRIKGYLANCCGKNNYSQEIDKVIVCIADILRMEEQRGELTEPAIKQMLALLESNKPEAEMIVVLGKIEVMAKEPIVVE